LVPNDWEMSEFPLISGAAAYCSKEDRNNSAQQQQFLRLQLGYLLVMKV
jgi:hypothetical protein